MCKKRAFIFFMKFEFPRESSRDRRPHPSPRGQGQGEQRGPPKNPSVSSAHAPSTILSYGSHMDEPSGSSSYIRALRVRVRVTRL